jgi:hypothetical protein
MDCGRVKTNLTTQGHRALLRHGGRRSYCLESPLSRRLWHNLARDCDCSINVKAAVSELPSPTWPDSRLQLTIFLVLGIVS